MPAKPKVIFVGDSTVKNGAGDGGRGQWGWGDRIASLFDTSRIEVINRAHGGRSSRTFISEGKWDAVLEMLEKGDFVLIQFGHNDSSPVNDTSRARGTIRGTGEETEEIDNLLTGKHEIVHSFGWYLRRYAGDAKAKGAVPVLVSPVPRKDFEGGRIRRCAGDYGFWARQTAEAENTPFIDLNEMAAAELDRIAASFGPEVLDACFKDDHTHSSLAGAKMNAAMVVKGIRNLENCALKDYLLDRTYSFGKEGAGIPVSGSDCYGPGKGYGFDLGTGRGDRCFFSVALPEGNYEVSLELEGGKNGGLTVRGESRRLFLEKVKVPEGARRLESFTVNIRDKRIDKDREVSLKGREINKLNWDEKLTLELNGGSPAVQSIRIRRAEEALTVFLCGDSTVVDQDNEPWCGWGQMLPRFFGPGIAFANYAESGEAANTFIAEGRLEKLLSQAKAGDYLLIQFGHNDQKQSGPGSGPWGSYTESLKSFIAAARPRGMVPVLVTPVRRRKFENGRLINTHGEYPEALRRLAAEEKTPLIDLHEATKTLYESLEEKFGENGSAAAFVHYPAGTFPGQTEDLKDDSHFNGYGAYETARLVVEGIRQNGLDEILAFLRPEAAPFDPARPDDPGEFSLPLSPFTELEKPAGA
ncbi:MAG: rhamnogalacturonan acetylesterase [Treponema sp.]|jgi:lysophospholipase L1-like esterase|nr:rhamnogalacturonan acetylesterase [Treponema sp.]